MAVKPQLQPSITNKQMEDKSTYIKELEEFKNLLLIWYHGEANGDTRSLINKKLRNTRNLVLRAGTLKTFTISPPPMIGGMIMQNVDPFAMIFDPPYGQSLIPALSDMIDEAIGVIETNENFDPNPKKPTQKKQQENSISNRVFLVHGHDNELKETTARFLEKLDLKPIILHEQTSKGLTIIEKFEEYSDVAFAVVLLTPDDHGSKIGDNDNLLKRARQNVIFELGYFIGKLGRKNVVGLVKDNIEFPSDYTGVIYIGVDNSDGWKMMLSKEMKAAGLKIDLNKIFE